MEAWSSISKNMADLNYKFFIALIFLMIAIAFPAAALNRPPELTPIASMEILSGETLNFNLRASDPDGDQVTYSCDNLPANASLDPKTGSFSWTPSVDQVGIHELYFKASDGGRPSLSSRQTAAYNVVFRVKYYSKGWGLGVQEEGTIFETNNRQDLVPKVGLILIDGNPLLPSQKNAYSSENPRIEAEISSPYKIDQDSISVKLDGRKIENFSVSNVRTFGEKKNILSLNLEFKLQALAAGDHQLVLLAGNELGTSSRSMVISAGKLRVVDTPLCFPNPFSPRAGGKTTIQYTLSHSAEVDLMIFGSSVQIIKRFQFSPDSPGGKAGMNKVVWDGRTDYGTIVGNGIYVGTLVDRQSQNVLGKLKIVIY